MILSSNSFPDQSGRYRPLAESMFDMMDAFSSTFQKRMKEKDNSWTRSNHPDRSDWLGTMPLWGTGTPPLIHEWLTLVADDVTWSPGGMNYMPDPGNIPPKPPDLSIIGGRPGPLQAHWMATGKIPSATYYRSVTTDSVFPRVRIVTVRVSAGGKKIESSPCGHATATSSAITNMRSRTINWFYATAQVIFTLPSNRLLMIGMIF